ncbi:MAG: NUDIX hydrolase [Candidatus Nanohaloarchaea archaeon]
MGLRSWFSWKGQLLVAKPLSKLFWPPSSATAIVLDDGKILAIDTGNYLMPPGGTCKYGETFEETAVRETREETGVEIETVERIDETVNDAGGNESVFLAEPVTNETEDSWEGKARWIDIEDAEKRRWRFDRDVPRLIALARE